MQITLGSKTQSKPMNTQTELHIPPWQRHARQWMSALLVFSDLFSLFLAGTLAILARLCLGLGWQPGLYSQVIPVMLVCIAAYTFSQLYPGISLSPVEELRRLSIITSIVVFSLAGLTFFIHISTNYSRLTLGMMWILAFAFVPLGRSSMRWLAARLELWGEPVIVIGYGPRGRRLAAELRQNRAIGYWPLVALDGAADQEPGHAALPVLSTASNWEQHPQVLPVHTAIVVLSETPDHLVEKIIRHEVGNFQRVIMVPEKDWLISLGVTPVSLNGLSGFKINNQLVRKLAVFQKRVLDFLLTLVGLALISPFLLLIGVLIKLTSPGPVFYLQPRVGKGGKTFAMVKFRSMHEKAHEKLDELLAQNPGLQAEWDKYQKLKEDPRLTPIGEFLRKYSIDELPQLWNVLTGEMSLVGPRPFFPEQSEMYGDGFRHYIQVLPGITGMWQVHERNEAEFVRRAYWDEYYVRNWSVWLDMYILAKTVWVVLRREGAY